MVNMSCNKCGSTSVYATNIHLDFDYLSRFDNQKWDLYICDDCLQEFLNSCISTPNIIMKDDYWEGLEKAYAIK